jgi:hypothetical protein
VETSGGIIVRGYRKCNFDMFKTIGRRKARGVRAFLWSMNQVLLTIN